jgi:4-hydroxy-3-methylbut-2-en-1-yl diphosphate reductase
VSGSRDLLLFAPLRAEAWALRRAADRAVVVRTGAGPARAARAAATEEVDGATAVAVAGFGGSLDPSLRPGDLVVATEVRGPERTVACASAGILAAALRRRGIGAALGPIVSVDHLIRGDERERLRADGAIAVDMESAWLAEAAGDRPFVAIRAVVDGPGRELTRPLATLTGGTRAFRALSGSVDALVEWSRAIGPRRVVLAAPRSFCAGVERAIEIVERALDLRGPPVYVRKQIVHNVHVVRDLERRGAVFVDSVEDVPRGSTVVFSAHGVSPQVRDEAAARELHVIDATCPLVTKVHTEARRFARAGYTIFLVGHEGHEEVEGTTGEAPQAVRLIDGSGDADIVEPPDPSRVAYLTQTTLAVDEVHDVVSALQQRFPTLAGPGSDDICYATQNRQDAVKALATECDLVFVIGSGNSSNSKRLVEVAEREGTSAHLIDDEADIDPQWLIGAGTIGVTAGASAPEALVTRVLDALGGLGSIDVDERVVGTESMQFTLPVEVRER